MNSLLGNRIRKLREHENLLLKDVAPILDIDVTHLSKIETGQRLLKREYISKIEKLLNAEENELLTLWLADKIIGVVRNEKIAEEALTTASKQINQYK